MLVSSLLRGLRCEVASLLELSPERSLKTTESSFCVQELCTRGRVADRVLGLRNILKVVLCCPGAAKDSLLEILYFCLQLTCP